MCAHPNCPEPLAFYYHHADDGPLFIRHRCFRVYCLICHHLDFIPEENEGQPLEITHDCRQYLRYMSQISPGVYRVRCEKCGKIFQPDRVEFKHVQCYATCN